MGGSLTERGAYLNFQLRGHSLLLQVFPVLVPFKRPLSHAEIMDLEMDPKRPFYLTKSIIVI